MERIRQKINKETGTEQYYKPIRTNRHNTPTNTVGYIFFKVA